MEGYAVVDERGWTGRPMRRSDVQEALAHLFLRLNGYFTTGYIVHAPEWGKDYAEIDALAVRHPANAEPARMVPPSPAIDPSTNVTDLLICEAKSAGERLQFNDRLRTDRQVLESVLCWTGLVAGDAVAEAADAVAPLLSVGCPAERARQGVAPRPGLRVRAVFFSPERHRARHNQPWMLAADVVLPWIAECLRPPERRLSCSTQYDFTAWGRWLEPLVTYFKDLDASKEPTMAGLYAHVRVEDGV